MHDLLAQVCKTVLQCILPSKDYTEPSSLHKGLTKQDLPSTQQDQEESIVPIKSGLQDQESATEGVDLRCRHG